MCANVFVQFCDSFQEKILQVPNDIGYMRRESVRLVRGHLSMLEFMV